MDMYEAIEYQKLSSIHMANVIAEKIHVEKRMALTLMQKKIILFLLSLIQQDDVEMKETVIPIADFFRLLDLEYSGRNLEVLKKSIIDLCCKAFWLPVGENGRYEVVARWVSEASIDTEKAELHFKLDQKLSPFFLQLAGRARTIFQLGYALQFKSKYAIDLYELAARCKNMNNVYTMPIETALKRFGDGKYTQWAQLNRRVLEPAAKEVNAKSDLKITYNTVLNRRGKVTHIAFYVTKKTGAALELANMWKHQLPKTKSVNDQIREAFEDTLLDEAIDCGFFSPTNPEELDNFDPDEFLEWKQHLSKKEYDEVKHHA